MATSPFNPNEALPEDDDVISLFPAVERTFRDIIESWIMTEHGRSGHHTIPLKTTTQRDAITDWEAGSFVYNTTLSTLQIATSVDPDVWAAAAPAAEGDIPAGSLMIFINNAAPAGWTLNTSYNDRSLVITSSEASGATTSGTWTISGATITVGNTTLTTAQLPSHTHSYSDKQRSGTTTRDASGGVSVNQGEDDESRTSGSAGSGSSHTHTGSASFDGAWRPSHVKGIVCEKD